MMKRIGIISTSALFLVAGLTAPAYAQKDDHKDGGAPAKEQQSKPAEQQHTQQAKQSKPAEQQHTQQAQQSRPAEQQHTQQAQQSRSGEQQRPERSVAQQQTQRSMPALRLSARGSGRIPDDRFRADFGEGHRFVISRPVMMGGYSRFQYGGFWFGFVQPWPVGWYYTDDVYIDYVDGGYFLCDPYYPGARVSISVVL